MQETAKLLAALKQALRARGLTYADVAEALGVAESSVKRLFSTCLLYTSPSPRDS